MAYELIFETAARVENTETVEHLRQIGTGAFQLGCTIDFGSVGQLTITVLFKRHETQDHSVLVQLHESALVLQF